MAWAHKNGLDAQWVNFGLKPKFFVNAKIFKNYQNTKKLHLAPIVNTKIGLKIWVKYNMGSKLLQQKITVTNLIEIECSVVLTINLCLFFNFC